MTYDTTAIEDMIEQVYTEFEQSHGLDGTIRYGDGRRHVVRYLWQTADDEQRDIHAYIDADTTPVTLEVQGLAQRYEDRARRIDDWEQQLVSEIPARPAAVRSAIEEVYTYLSRNEGDA